MSARGAYAALAVGCALAGAYALTSGTVAGDTVVYLVAAGYGTLLSLVGALRMPPAPRRIWWAFFAAQALFLVGDALYVLHENVLHIDPYPSPADAAYLASYPALGLGMLWLVHGRRRGRDRAAMLDAAVLTTGVTVVAVVFLIAPAAAGGGTTWFEQVVAAAYPAGDLLVLALVFRMVTAGVVRNDALWALIGAVSLLLVADVVYVTSALQEAAYPAWVDVGYLLSYVLLGFAALHPSTHALADPAPDRPERITVTRLVWLGTALMLAPLTDQVSHLTGAGRGSWVVLVGGCVAAVLVVIRLGDLIHDLQTTAVQLAALARKDGLTGIPNRRSWDHELSRACAHARDSGTRLAVAVIDMDRFKQFNDTFGHVRGDLVLKESATAWASILDGVGFLARFGGEEFTVLIPNATDAEIGVLLDRMRKAVPERQTCSVGYALWDTVESPGELVARADAALYHAKNAGRDRIAFHDGSGAAVLSPGLARATISKPHAVYQPIVDLRTGEVLGHEALSRFEGEGPREAFDRAAREGTTAFLEAAAIRSALSTWSGTGLLTLNTGLGTLLTPELQAALPDDLAGIVIEITEADLVDYSAEVMLAIDDLRARGALIAIDDFGVGFSNVQRIAMIRPDLVKLDMSIIRDIDKDPMLQAIVAGAMVFAELTGSRVVAEGIESVAERDCLTSLGVTLGQGFLLGMPGPLDEAAAQA